MKSYLSKLVVQWKEPQKNWDFQSVFARDCLPRERQNFNQATIILSRDQM